MKLYLFWCLLQPSFDEIIASIEKKWKMQNVIRQNNSIFREGLVAKNKNDSLKN